MTRKYKSVTKECSICRRVKVMAENRVKCDVCRQFESNVSKGVIRKPDYEYVNTKNYKDPMEKVIGGYGYYGAFTQTNDGELIQCHICGYYYADVGSHVKARHNMPVRDYKVKYGLRIKQALWSDNQRERRQDFFNKFNRSTKDYKAMSARAQKVIKEKGIKRGGSTWQPITRNEKGMCKEQTAAKIHALAKKMNNRPNQMQFLKEYGTGQASVVNHWYGSWRNALEELGYDDFFTALTKDKHARIEEALANMRRFYELNGRTPQWADFNTVDYLPKGSTVQKWFGSLNNARREAEVPIIVRKGRSWEEVI